MFDEVAANQSLFPANDLILNRENIYYCSANNKGKLSFPARILWYISEKGKNGIEQQVIKACSYLDFLEVGEGKDLFKKYKKLGVYEWKDISKMIKNEDGSSKPILAFKFSDTILFNNPISLAELKEIYENFEKKNLTLQSPVKISTECFNFIYQKGE